MSESVKRTVRVKTTQHILEGEKEVSEGFPIRKWSIEICLLDQNGNEIPGNIFEKVVYHLHPTFANPNRTFKKPPFRIEEKGWGGFDLLISCSLLDKAGERKINHDLHFRETEYQVDHVINVPAGKPALNRALQESGPVPLISEENIGDKRKNGAVEPKNKKAKTSAGSAIKGGVNLEELALGLTKLNEDALVGVVQMVTDNRTPEMNIKNDVEEGEFVMDLYSLPDLLLKSLFDYVKKNT